MTDAYSTCMSIYISIYTYTHTNILPCPRGVMVQRAPVGRKMRVCFRADASGFLHRGQCENIGAVRPYQSNPRDHNATRVSGYRDIGISGNRGIRKSGYRGVSGVSTYRDIVEMYWILDPGVRPERGREVESVKKRHIHSIVYT